MQGHEKLCQGMDDASFDWIHFQSLVPLESCLAGWNQKRPSFLQRRQYTAGSLENFEVQNYAKTICITTLALSFE